MRDAAYGNSPWWARLRRLGAVQRRTHSVQIIATLTVCSRVAVLLLDALLFIGDIEEC